MNKWRKEEEMRGHVYSKYIFSPITSHMVHRSVQQVYCMFPVRVPVSVCVPVSDRVRPMLWWREREREENRREAERKRRREREGSI
mmetsp:Transcript_26761/g.30055  ORF Transcript_26761/g.30055 Transcript_26761/m.30055 type:complete len:86 (-) Transcript_26761:199-456(-)